MLVTDANDINISPYNSEHIANLNPLRYRGYYYDTETGFYYLQSRYYDPVIHRFINADTFASTDSTDAIACNMFAYCCNSVVTFCDPTGTRPVQGRGRGAGFVEYMYPVPVRENTITVFYNTDEGWITTANRTGQDLCNAIGADSYCTIPAETGSFKDSWGRIKSPYVLIEVHGSPTLLGTPSSFRMGISEANELPQNTRIKCVIITVCSSGKMTPGQMNIAQVISTKINPEGIIICATQKVLGNGIKYRNENQGAWIIYQNGVFVPTRLHSTLTMDYAAELIR